MLFRYNAAMLTLYTYSGDDDSLRVREALRDRALRFEERALDSPGPPRLVDRDIDATGVEEIATALESLDEFAREWYRFQSDSCYIDDDGTVC